MKILFVLGFPNPFAGAAWTRVGFFTEYCSKQGHDVAVLGTFTASTLKERGAVTSGRVNIFNLIPNVDLNHPIIFSLNNLASFLVSVFFLIVKRPTIAVISVPGRGVEVGAISACMVVGCRYIIDYRDEWEDYAVSTINSKGGKAFYSMVKRFAGFLYSKSQLLITVTSNFKVALEQRGLANVKLVSNGADINTFKPLSTKPSGQFKLFYSGGIGLYYKLDVVLKALKRFVDKGANDAVLIVAGGGEVDALLSMASKLGVSKNINYQGVIREKIELANLIAKADVGLIPYDDNPLWKNSLPAKFFEYCACGIPIIATAYEDSLLAKFVKEYEIGIISPPMNEVT